jgi:hypothetical protein
MADLSLHLRQVHETWQRLKLRKENGNCELNGHTLEVADVVAVAE